MDTEWFAVDRDGHVGVFSTGETGTVPRGAPRLDGVDFDILEAIRSALSAEEARGTATASEEPWTAGLGLFCYGPLEEYMPFQGRYGMTYRPEAPLHVDRLPPRLRGLLKEVRFGEVRFADAECVQPAEQFQCDCWGYEEEDAYLATDGVTLRPVPGREHLFAAYCEMLRREHPKVAARLRFETPGAGKGPGREEGGS
jgi:hypothetical protein